MKIQILLLSTITILHCGSLENFLGTEQKEKSQIEKIKYYKISNLDSMDKHTEISLHATKDSNKGIDNVETLKSYNQSQIYIKEQVRKIKLYANEEKEYKKHKYISLEKRIEKEIKLPENINTNEKIIININQDKINFIKRSKYEEVNNALIDAINNIEYEYKNNKTINLHIILYRKDKTKLLQKYRNY